MCSTFLGIFSSGTTKWKDTLLIVVLGGEGGGAIYQVEYCCQCESRVERDVSSRDTLTRARAAPCMGVMNNYQWLKIVTISHRHLITLPNPSSIGLPYISPSQRAAFYGTAYNGSVTVQDHSIQETISLRLL